MRYTIAGAGFCGVATAYYLLKLGHQVTLYDEKGIAGGASGVAAGLLHPYAGAHGKTNSRADEGMTETLKLLDVAGVTGKKGLFRLALSEQQRQDFYANQPQLWKEGHEIPGVIDSPGLYIEEAYAIDTKKYLEGLWKACEKLGGKSVPERSDNPDILCGGFASKKLFPELPLNAIKGQILRMSWPEDLPPLPHPINSKAYVIMDGKSCWVGSSFERNFKDLKPDLEEAKRQILPKAYEMIPALEGCAILDCKAGVRASAPGHRPFLEKVDNTWILSGMGSKGLLYHALFAKELVRKISCI